MTNAIEQAKREFYSRLAAFKMYAVTLEALEESLESYLELLHQDSEALHETARKRFEDIKESEAISEAIARHTANSMETIRDLESRLAKMTEERDSIQLRLHAVDHAYNEQQSRAGTSGQVSGDRVSCEAPDAKTMGVLRAVEDIQGLVSEWALGEAKAKWSIRKIAAIVNGDSALAKLIDGLKGPSEFDLYMGNQRKAAATGIEISAKMLKLLDEKSWKMTFLVDKIANIQVPKQPQYCQHSFFAIGDDQMKCTFCGVGK